MGTPLLLTEHATATELSGNEGSNSGLRSPAATGGPLLKFDVATEIERLRREAAWARGRNAKTLAKHGDMRIVLAIIAAGKELNEHHAHGTVSVQVVQGCVRTRILDELFELSAGHLLVLDPEVAHNLEATEDSAVLLTIGWRPRETGGKRHEMPLRDACDA